MAAKSLPSLTKKDVDRLWAGIQIMPNGCWEWQQGCGTWGYGCIQIKRWSYRTHRIAYLVYYLIDPGEQKVLHHCDNPPCINPPCINPFHLYLGTDEDNARDRERRQRGNHASGTRHGTHTKPETVLRGAANGFAKLTQEQVDTIRQRYAFRKVTFVMLGEEYGVSRQTIMDIVQRRSYV